MEGHWNTVGSSHPIDCSCGDPNLCDPEPVPAMRDGDKLTAWLREAAYEIDKAHALLDSNRVPRSLHGNGVEMTLAARIAYALGARS